MGYDVYIPPDDECTLTVGLEAIVGDLEGLLNLRGDGHTFRPPHDLGFCRNQLYSWPLPNKP